MVCKGITQLTGKLGGNERKHFCIIQFTNPMDQTNLIYGIYLQI